MGERITARRRMAGITLLEVLVAFSILSVSLVLIISIVSGGLRTAARGADYSHAVALAEARLAAMTLTEAMYEGASEGVFDDRYRWRATVAVPAWWRGPDTADAVTPYEIKVEVVWQDFGREFSVSLTTLHLAYDRT
jgi:general secretion pathway protein I